MIDYDDSKMTKTLRRGGNFSDKKKFGIESDWIPLLGWIGQSVDFVPNFPCP